jgi:hypothetical protein
VEPRHTLPVPRKLGRARFGHILPRRMQAPLGTPQQCWWHGGCDSCPGCKGLPGTQVAKAGASSMTIVGDDHAACATAVVDCDALRLSMEHDLVSSISVQCVLHRQGDVVPVTVNCIDENGDEACIQVRAGPLCARVLW